MHWVILSLILVSTRVALGNDVCYAPFSAFLKCMADDADKKLERYLNELSPAVKQQVQQCFAKQSCETPDFSKATVDNFLSPPWNERANTILDLMENMNPKVKDCMITYFKGLIKEKLEECVHKVDELKDFELPPLPDIHNTDITKFKEVVLNRMLIRTYVNKCTDNKGAGAANKTIDCIADARSEHDKTMCTTREQCRQSKIPDSKCRDRFDKVHEAACKCAQNRTNIQKEALRMLVTGELERQFKKCHDDNGVPYPQDKIDKIKDTISTVISEFMAHKDIPADVKKTMHVAGQAFKDIEEQWKGAFCATCSKDGDKSSLISDQEIKDLRKMVDSNSKEH